jgi:hypothetical protein
VRTFKDRHPRLYAYRHVAAVAGEMAVALVGIAALVNLLLDDVLRWMRDKLPDIRLPHIDLPGLPNLPSLPLPELPDIHLPGWVGAVVDVATYVVPFAIAVAVAQREIRRRRRTDENS